MTLAFLILSMFRRGLDTLSIAEKLARVYGRGKSPRDFEPEIVAILIRARDAERQGRAA